MASLFEHNEPKIWCWLTHLCYLNKTQCSVRALKNKQGVLRYSLNIEVMILFLCIRFPGKKDDTLLSHTLIDERYK